MHVSNNSIASLFQQLQAMASGSAASSSFGAQLTGQNLPTITSGGSPASSLAPSPLSATPASQFAANLLSALLSAQQSLPSAQSLAGQVISAIEPNGNGSPSLSQAGQAPAGGSATTSPQQTSIANAFSQLDANADNALSQGELASALQALQAQTDPTQATGGRRHHHRHADGASSSTDQSASTTSTAPDAATAGAASDSAAASVAPSTPVAA